MDIMDLDICICEAFLQLHCALCMVLRGLPVLVSKMQEATRAWRLALLEAEA